MLCYAVIINVLTVTPLQAPMLAHSLMPARPSTPIRSAPRITPPCAPPGQAQNMM